MVDLHAWVDAFSRRVTGHPARTAPRPLLGMLARAGDAITSIRGTPFLVQTARLESMSTDYPVPMAPIFDLAGEPPYSLERAIDESVAWVTAGGQGA